MWSFIWVVAPALRRMSLKSLNALIKFLMTDKGPLTCFIVKNFHESCRMKKLNLLLAVFLSFPKLTEASPGHTGHDTPSEDLSLTAPFEAAKVQNPIELNAESLAEGKKLYLQHCPNCHGKDGARAYQSGKRTLQLNAISSEREAGDLAWKIISGRGEMPSWKDKLNSDAIWKVVYFLQQEML